MTNLTFSEYRELTESLDLDVGEVKRDHDMEQFAQMMVSPDAESSVRVLYNKHMHDNDLRVIKFKSDDDSIEYHIHNHGVMPGAKSGNTSKLGLLSCIKIMHDDAKKELEAGNTIKLQTNLGSPHFEKFKVIAKKLADAAGKQVVDGGIKPITTAPFMKGPVLLIKN